MLRGVLSWQSPARNKSHRGRASRYWGRAGPGSVGSGGNGKGNHFTPELTSQLGACEGRREERTSAVNGGEEGKVRGKKGSGGVRRRDEDKRGQEGAQIPFRIRSGGSQQSNPITEAVYCAASADRVLGWTLADRIIEWMEQIKLSMGTNSRSSSQSIRSGPILSTSRIRVMYGDRQT